MKETEIWWQNVSQSDYEGMLPKVGEYGGATEAGSTDLRIMGFALSQLHMPPKTPEAVQQEATCWMYALGKVARLINDYNRGEPGKADSWHDATVYTMMARRLQTTGRWP